ncbi:hypothetical protein ACKI1O_47470, partial [Streptomyces scabiei]
WLITIIAKRAAIKFPSTSFNILTFFFLLAIFMLMKHKKGVAGYYTNYLNHFLRTYFFEGKKL